MQLAKVKENLKERIQVLEERLKIAVKSDDSEAASTARIELKAAVRRYDLLTKNVLLGTTRHE